MAESSKIDGASLTESAAQHPREPDVASAALRQRGLRGPLGGFWGNSNRMGRPNPNHLDYLPFPNSEKIRMKRLASGLLVSCGTLCVALGVLGMFVPVLPTTPFLLLAAICYARSSERFYQWLLRNRWFGEYLRNYRAGRGIPLREKLLTLITLWLTIGFTAGHVLSVWWGQLILLGVAVGVTLHLARIRTFERDADNPLSKGAISAEKSRQVR